MQTIAHQLTQQYGLVAWQMASGNRLVHEPLLFHSSGSVPDTCQEFRKQLKAMLLQQHMNMKGNCWDKSLVESFLLLQEVKQRASQEYVGSAFIGLSEAYLGNIKAAFEYLEKAYHDRGSVLLTFPKELWVPAFLRAEPRFQKIMDNMAFLVSSPLAVAG